MTRKAKLRVLEKLEDTMLLALKVQEGVTARVGRGPVEAGKGKEMGAPPGPQREHGPASAAVSAPAAGGRLLTYTTVR